MPRQVKPLVKPNREPDVSATRADGQVLRFWVREIKSRAVYRHKQETPGAVKFGLIAYVDDTAVPVSQTFPSRDAALSSAGDLCDRAAGRG
jgi:hypothetical protein